MSELLADKSIHVTRSLLTVVLATLAHCFSAVAQVDGELLQPRVYVPADFARFAPRTALDMARQVPGFPIDEGGQGRGFGQANTNILINGRRVSGKSNGPITTLRRIPVDVVSRLEVVDGASLDIGGLSGQVLNVITVADRGISGRFSYSMQSRTDHVPTRWRDGALSFAGGNRASEWTLNLRNEQSKSGDEGPEFVTDGSSAVVETRDERRVESFDIPGVAGSYTYLGQGGQVLNASGEVNAFILEFQERSERNPIDGDSGIRRLRETEDEFNFEVGFDYEQDALSGRLKLIGIHRYEDSPTVADVRLDVVSDGSIAGSRFERRAEEAETLLRSEFTHRAFDGDWQWALEGAFNFLDIEAALEVRDDDGQLRTVPAPGASSRVEEDRFELTVSYGRALTQKIQLQSSLGLEYSRIQQMGDTDLERDFVRPKGFVSINWRPLRGTTAALQIERRVGQLNFFDFIAAVNVNVDRVNVSNANLVPPQSWVVNLQLQQSLGPYGSLTLGGFYEDITDSIDRIPIDGGGQAPGNVESAERLGLSTTLTLLSDPLGWRGTRFDLDAAIADSQVEDPVTGEMRQLSDIDRLDYEATLRQDFANTSWAAGIELFFEENTPLTRVDEISVFRPSSAFTRVFVENKDVFGATVRGSVANLNNRGNDFFRTVFNDRNTNDIAFSEDRFREFGLLFRIDVEGSF